MTLVMAAGVPCVPGTDGTVADEAVARSVRMLGATKPETARVPVILDPFAGSSFLGVLAGALTAEAVQKGRSLFANLVGAAVGSPAVTIVDDGRRLDGPGSAPFDDEGVPTGRTPLIVIDIPAFGGGPQDRTVILYGHLDKQPEMTGWREDLGPWKPVIEGRRLYGRGGADDGYAAFASLTAIEAVQANGGSHARCVVLIEASEESGSCDLPAHLEALGDRLAGTELVLCLDSGCLDDERQIGRASCRERV